MNESRRSIVRTESKICVIIQPMKIKQKYANLLFVFLTAVFMSFLMSFVVSISNLGFHAGLVSHWMRAWGFSFLVGFPIISFVVPAARKIVDKITY